jgi:hypothetical protein
MDKIISKYDVTDVTINSGGTSASVSVYFEGPDGQNRGMDLHIDFTPPGQPEPSCGWPGDAMEIKAVYIECLILGGYDDLPLVEIPGPAISARPDSKEIQRAADDFADGYADKLSELWDEWAGEQYNE